MYLTKARCVKTYRIIPTTLTIKPWAASIVADGLMCTVDVLFIVGACIFPLILMVYLVHSKEVRFSDGVKAIGAYNKVAVNYGDQLFDRYKVVVFAPNVLGIIGNAVATYFSTSASMATINNLFSYHIALLIVTAAGLAILKTASTRLLLVLLGEIASNWALVGGCLILGYYLAVVTYQISHLASVVSLIVLGVFLVAMIYFEMTRSAKTYVEGAKQWKPSAKRNPKKS